MAKLDFSLQETLQHQATTWQALSHRAISASTVYDLGFLLDRHLTMKDHVSALCRSCYVLLAATSTLTRQVVADVWHRNDTCTRLHQQLSWLLQQLAVRCWWQVAEETTRRSECSCSGGDRNKKVRPHHTCASRPPLASSPSVQAVRELSTSWPWQFISAYMDWHRHTWLTTVWLWQSLLSPASDTCGPLSPGHYSYQGQRSCWGWGVSPSQAQSSGTVYQPPCQPQLSLLLSLIHISEPTRPY